MDIRLIASALMVVAATGCASTRYTAKLPDVSSHCVSTLRDVQPTALRVSASPKQKPAPVEFAEVAKCFRGPDGTTVPIALYRLEDVARPAQVSVRALMSQGGTFAASVQVLDAALSPIQEHRFDRFVRRGSEYSLDVFLNAGGAEPTYVLLSPDMSQVGKSDTTVGSSASTLVVPVGLGAFTYIDGKEAKEVRPLMQGGKLAVTVAAQTSAPMSTE